MAERSFPLENTVYNAEEAALWFATRTSGVYANDELKVKDTGGMFVAVEAGIAWLAYKRFAGVAYGNTEEKALAIPTANTTMPRIDRIVVRYSSALNGVILAVLSGTPSASPIPPTLRRTENIYEISLAQVYVGAGATEITAANITDERLNNDVCGLMRDGVTRLQTEELKGDKGDQGEPGASPYIGGNGNWFAYDDRNKKYYDTGFAAEGVDGNDGQPGDDGVSPTLTVSTITGGHKITIKDASGTKSVDVLDGKDGQDGEDGHTPVKGVDYVDGKDGKDGVGIETVIYDKTPDENGVIHFTIQLTDGRLINWSVQNGEDGADGSPGADGVGIASVKQTTTSSADGGNNVVTVTLTNGASSTFTVKNGSKGSTGSDGDDGVGIASAVLNEDYTLTLNFTNGTKYTTPSIRGATGSPGSDATVTAANITAALGYTPADAANVDNVPDYVVTEAMSVLDKVISAQSERTFVLAAITDMHYGSSDYIDGVIHACQGLQHISERIKLDALAVLGDFTDEHQMDTETAVTDLEEMNALLNPLRTNANLRLKGNHDHRPNGAAQTYRYIMSHSDDVVWGSRIGGYFYRDFDACKLRIVCLNTTEVARDNLSVSDEQYQWFADSLNLSAKTDSAEWRILILSHHPLDWTVTSGAYKFGPILNAYQTGGSWSSGNVSCNYAGKNTAIIVANIHGHIHNLLTDKIYIGEAGNSTQTSVYRMATAAARVDYVNHYSGVWVENRWDSKTPNTADDTAFVVYCIDLDAFTIKAYCYGAGYDRELTYYVAEVPIINLIDTVGYQDNTRVNSSGSHVTENGYTSTNKIDVSMGDVYRTSGVNFDAATYSRGNLHFWASDGNNSYVVTNSSQMPYSDANLEIKMDAAKNLTITIKSGYPKQITLTGYGSGANLIVTRNQEIS